jgi:hypothetical protein
MSDLRPDTVARMVAEAKEHVETLPVERVAARSREGRRFSSTCARRTSAFWKGALSNAMHVPRGMLNSWPIRPAPSKGRSSILRTGSFSIAPRGAGRRWERIPLSEWATRRLPTLMGNNASGNEMDGEWK